MRIRCPHCSQPIELVPDLRSDDVTCPSCGSHFSLLGHIDDTETIPLGRRPTLEHFDLIEELGVGQFGRVWKAFDQRLRRVVAIKVPHSRVLSAAERRYFRHEANSAAKLNHPNIVSIYEIAETDETIYIVSEYIDGPSMRVWMTYRKPRQDDAARLCATIARALDYAHQQSVIHRDLKPGNIVMDSDEQPHITDFGLAKQVDARFTIAMTGRVIGTPAYMSPEQIRDGHQVDARSDVYALGTILYEMLTGERPFDGGRKLLFQRILFDEPRRPRAFNPRIDRQIEAICLHALEKNPDARYQTAAAFADDLEAFLNERPIAARIDSRFMHYARWLMRRPAIAASLALAALVLILAWFVIAPVPSPTELPIIDGPTVVQTTDPPGAEVIFVPIDQRTGELHPERMRRAGKSPVRLKLEMGDYLVVAYTPDGSQFHEVYRHVPGPTESLPGIYPRNHWTKDATGAYHLTPIKLFRQSSVIASMVKIQGGDVEAPPTDRRGIARASLPDWYVDPTETTYGIMVDAGLRMPDSMAQLQLSRDHPVVGLSLDEATSLAEHLGKRLMTAQEYAYLISQGSTPEDAEPDLESTPVPGPAIDPQWDRIESPRFSAPLVALRGNVMEWTCTWWTNSEIAQYYRIIVGELGLAQDTDSRNVANSQTPTWVRASVHITRDRQLGVRCARSARPRIRPSDFARVRFQPILQPAALSGSGRISSPGVPK